MVASRYLISNGQFIYFEGKKQSRDNPQKAPKKKKKGRKYTLNTRITAKNKLKSSQEATNRRVGEDRPLIDVGIRRGEDRLLINVRVRVGEDWLLDANALSPRLGLSQHCYDIPHRRPFLGVLSSAEKCYSQHEKHFFLNMLTLAARNAGVQSFFRGPVSSDLGSNPFDKVGAISKCRV